MILTIIILILTVIFYKKILLPAQIKKQPWYHQYQQTYQKIVQAKNRTDLKIALDYYNDFTSSKKQCQSYYHKKATHHLINHFYKKFNQI